MQKNAAHAERTTSRISAITAERNLLPLFALLAGQKPVPNPKNARTAEKSILVPPAPNAGTLPQGKPESGRQIDRINLR